MGFFLMSPWGLFLYLVAVAGGLVVLGLVGLLYFCLFCWLLAGDRKRA